METKRLPSSQWDSILQRLAKTVQEIKRRQDPTSNGRVIPNEDSLLVGTGSHLDLAVLFLDICKFTSWKTADFEEQERVLTVFNLFMTEMIRIGQDYGGEVEKNTGDGLMAYFRGESPNYATTACEKARAAALTMFYVAEKVINPLLSGSGFQAVNFRVGIDYGPVTIAEVGARRGFHSRVAIGATANIANRMLRKAGENQLVIGEQVYLALSPELKKWCQFLTSETGFSYVQTGLSYPYYLYTGRWTEPK